MKVLQKAKKVVNSIKVPMPKYRKGNNEGAIAGIIAGLVLLGGAFANQFTSAFASLLGNASQYLTAFLSILGFIALVGGFLEYRRVRKLLRN
ncbi:conjugal transfer protein [Saccharolobus caldissimus]|uniref:Uncharacterized protein n=1 Tax=Saccharolobus caldissimus TaxID=1702097 RepID=A0AAQ4CNS9_9CREN|nr:conjugal transfer protein [Saccharolobus caldissimus]BDB97460.1 hypothetical protein SACC_04770 [Saccharolobus caldissimus]